MANSEGLATINEKIIKELANKVFI